MAEQLYTVVPMDQANDCELYIAACFAWGNEDPVADGFLAVIERGAKNNALRNSIIVLLEKDGYKKISLNMNHRIQVDEIHSFHPYELALPKRD